MPAGDINKIVGAILVALLTATVVGQIAKFVSGEGEHGAVHEVAAVGEQHPAMPAAQAPAEEAPAPAEPAVAEAPAAEPAPQQQAAAPAAEPAAPAAEAPAPAGGDDVLAMLATADPAAGKKLSVRCVACHTFDAGGANKVGPNLYNVVGRDKGSVADYAYSDAMKNAGGEWTYEDLDHFLTNPKGFVEGTKMTFSGLPSADDRAALIAFLREQSDSPAPLPAN